MKRAIAELENDLILRAARGEPTERVPVWIMRQAGRYLPEFREIRAESDFFVVCRTPELAAEVTLQPLRRFPLDAAIIFSDILVVPQAMGLEIEMRQGYGPHFPRPLSTPDEMTRLRDPDVTTDLRYVADAITLTREKLQGRVPLIGFSGAPWTLMAYMVEGGSSKSFSRSRSWFFQFPEHARNLLETLANIVIQYVDLQIRAGAQVVQIFDSWAGLLGPRTFRQFVLPSLARIAAETKRSHPDTPLIIFARGANYAIHELARTDFDVVAVDWTVEPEDARAEAGTSVTLQGNLDPSTLYARPGVIRREVERMMEGFGTQRYIANLGHGMLADHSPDHAGAFVAAVHEVSSEMNRVPH